MIFESEIQLLQVQISDLETLISDRRRQIEQLQLGENIANSLLNQTTVALQTLRPMGEGAIARLKANLLNLFGHGDDNPPTDPGNGPGDGGSTPPRGDNDGSMGGEVEQPYNPMQVAQDEPEIMTNLEDEFLVDPETTDYEDIGFIAIPEQQPYAELARLSKDVAYFRRHDATPLTAYAGFSAKARAEAWGRWLVSFSIAQGFEVRHPKHLTDHKHELKLWELNLAQVLALSESDLTRTPGTKTAERFPGAIRREQQPPVPSYTKPTHRLYVNGEEKLYADEMTVRRIYNEAIALPDTLHARILSAYRVESEYHKDTDSASAGLEPPTDWGTVKPHLHTFKLKSRQIEQLGAIARMYQSLGFKVRDGLTGSSTPNWGIFRGRERLGELFYTCCSWQLETEHPDLAMDDDDFIDQLRDWDVLTEEEAIA